MIALGSIFRNSCYTLPRFFRQVAGLRGMLDGELRLILVEGDSTDNTRVRLAEMAANYKLEAEIVVREHGGPVYGSVVNEERFRQLAYCGNGVLEHLRPDDKALLYVESDLAWQPSTLARLLGRLGEVAAVAPMVLRLGRFYDTWGFRKGGLRFTAAPPYHPALLVKSGLVRLDSAGSCLALRGDVARRVRYPAEDVIVGLCRQIEEGVWLDPSLSVTHP